MRRLILASLALAAACAPEEQTGPTMGELDGMAACTDDAIAAHDGKSCHTFRAITGASMGGGAAARLAFSKAPLFDSVGIMGTPLADLEALWQMLRDNQLGGFCDLATLTALRDADPTALDTAAAFCGQHDVPPTGSEYTPVRDTDHVTPDGRCPAFASDFNHWYRGPEEGRGSIFDRDYFIQVFDDLVNAFGNPLASTLTGDGDASDCASPALTVGVPSLEHNPNGSAPLVSFCDGAVELTGDYDPLDVTQHTLPLPFLRAVDLNNNGRRDYGEPIALNDRERFTDAAEDGSDLAWHAFTAPGGTRENGRWDDGEPFADDGIDGVPGTGDFGEGNGRYDLAPALARWRAQSPSTLYRALSDTQVDRLDVWMDAGVRDFLNSGQISNRLWAAFTERLAERGESPRIFQDFSGLPTEGESNGFSVAYFDASREALGAVSYLQYGDPDICPSSDSAVGDGNHVGPSVVNRMFSLFAHALARMPEDDRRTALGGDISNLDSPNGETSDFAFLDRWVSEETGKEREFGVMLPLDYYAEPERRYPVVYFLHGQGNSPQQLLGLNVLLLGPMKESARRDRQQQAINDMQRAIVVFPDGQCGDECFTGNFFTDFESDARPENRFGSATIELMRVVEERYRTLAPRFE